MRRALLTAVVLVFFLTPAAPSRGEDPLYEKIYSQYPRSAYMVGIGEAPKTGSTIRDKRVSEVLASRELAAQIRVHVSEVAVDVMCSGSTAEVAGSEDACREEFTSVLETRVDQFIQGSRIVQQGEYEGRVYAVAVMAKKGTADELMKEAEESAERAKKLIEKSRTGDTGSKEKAREEYLRAKAFAAQSDALEGVRGRADELFGPLDEEIKKLGSM